MPLKSWYAISPNYKTKQQYNGHITAIVVATTTSNATMDYDCFISSKPMLQLGTELKLLIFDMQ